MTAKAALLALADDFDARARSSRAVVRDDASVVWEMAAKMARDAAGEERQASSSAAAHRASREDLGRVVREAWIAWARRQPNPKPSWLVPWGSLPAPDREVDMLIGEAVREHVVRTLAGVLREEP